jgi:hypothetical protein
MSDPKKASRILSMALAVLVIGLSACGGDDDDETTASDETTATQPADGNAGTDAQDLDQFLMQKDEEPGFRQGAAPGAQPAEGGTTTGVNAFVKSLNLTPADARRLRNEGFIAYSFEPIRGPRSAGVTNVALYKTAEGAKHSLAHETRKDVIRAFGPVENLRIFSVSGIPGARGWTASDPHVANVYWVQGRCMLVLGNQGPGPVADHVSTGARAIYKRTDGECP